MTATEFRILGPLEVVVDGAAVELGPPKQQALLALLLLNANAVVPRERAIDLMWGEDPPTAAVNALQVYVHGLRKVLGSDRIVTQGNGYLLRAAPNELDLAHFERLFEQGRSAYHSGRLALADERLREAIELWRSEPLEGIDTVETLVERERLRERLLAAKEIWTDVRLALGSTDGLAEELEALIHENPYRERLRAQLMLVLYRSGRQAEALETYQRTRRALRDELGIEPSSALRELESAILRQDSSLLVAARSARGALPRPLTSLVGRRLEVAAVSSLLREPDSRLVTLTGAGGVGKTRLALAVAETLAAELGEGACFCRLASLRDPSLVSSTVIAELGGIETAEPDDALISMLQGRELLVVLDNFEHVAAAAPLVASMLESSSHLRVLVTSRVALRISGEREYEVRPLSVPTSERGAPGGVDANVIAESDAVKLFVDRARLVQPDLTVDERNAPHIAGICARLDGLPLALELAAPQLKLLAPDALLARLDRRLPMLKSGAADLPARQRTLAATIDWSYALLTEPVRQLFEELAVFVGGWTLDAAEAICVLSPDVLEGIGKLLDSSLVRRRPDATGTVRFDMLATVREYALQRLEDSGFAADLRRRHAEWFLAFAERADRDSRGVRGTDELERLEAEHDNLRAALEWLHEHGDGDSELRLAIALTRFWWLRGHVAEARRRLHDALGHHAGQTAQLRTEALRRAAVLAGVQGDYEIAKELAAESQALYEELGDRRGIATALSTRAEAHLHAGSYEPAREFYLEARSIFSELSDDWDVAAATVNLGYVALGEGSHDQAAELAAEGLRTLRELGDANGTATALYVLGAASVASGDQEGAARWLDEALRLFAQVGDKEGSAECLHAIAALTAAADPVCAAELTGVAETLREHTGSALAQFQLDWRDETIDEIRRRLRDDEWRDAFKHGAELTFEEAVRHATTGLLLRGQRGHDGVRSTLEEQIEETSAADEPGPSAK